MNEAIERVNIYKNALNSLLEAERIECRVVKRGNKWCLVHCHGPDAGKVIKCFPTKEQAEKMHRAIMVNKYGSEKNEANIKAIDVEGVFGNIEGYNLEHHDQIIKDWKDLLRLYHYDKEKAIKDLLKIWPELTEKDVDLLWDAGIEAEKKKGKKGNIDAEDKSSIIDFIDKIYNSYEDEDILIMLMEEFNLTPEEASEIFDLYKTLKR